MTLNQHIYAANIAYDRIQAGVEVLRKEGVIVTTEAIEKARTDATEAAPFFPMIEARRGRLV